MGKKTVYAGRLQAVEALEAWKRRAAGDPAKLAEELKVKELLSA